MKTTNLKPVKLFVGVAVVALTLLALWYFSSIVVYILVSAVLAVIGRPLVHQLSGLKIGSWRVPRPLAAFITLVVIWAVTATLCSLFIPLILTKVYHLANLDWAMVIERIEAPISEAQTYLNGIFPVQPSDFSLTESLAQIFHEMFNMAAFNSLFSSVVGVIFSVVIAVLSISFITFFFLKDDGLFYTMVTSAFPDKYHDNIIHALDSITLLLSRYFAGILGESFVLMLAVISVMSLWGMDLSDACIIGLVMAVMNVVPYAGPFIGGIISVFIGLITPIEGFSIAMTAFVIAGSLLVLKGLDDFVLQPALYSERVKAHPLEIFIVILIAGSMAGIVGMLLAIPMYTVLRVFAKEFFSQFSLVRKLTEKI